MAGYQRLEWIDSVKGIGIILVLIGHCNIPNINEYIYLFHMPLFYIISGYCWNVDKNKALSFKDFTKNKYKTLIVPYFKISTICFILFGIGGDLIRIGYGPEYLCQLAKYLFGITIYSRGTTEWLPTCSPIWFLTALFLAEVFFHWIMRRNKVVFFVVVAGGLGYFCYLCGKVFPWNIDNALTAIPFLYVGVLIRKYWREMSKLRYLLVYMVVTAMVFCFGILGGDFDGNSIGGIYFTGLEAIIVSTCIMSLIYQISLTRIGGGISCRLQNTLVRIL